MILPKFPKNMAKQSITFKKYIGTDDFYKKPKYENPVEIKNCVVQLQTVYSGTNNNREVVANATAFLYAGITTPMPKITKENRGSVITYKGVDYTLKTITENLDPFSNELWSYELDVI